MQEGKHTASLLPALLVYSCYQGEASHLESMFEVHQLACASGELN